MPGRSGPFGPLTPFAERVARLARDEGVTVSAFGPEDLDNKTGRLMAALFDGETDGWIFQDSPLPTVIWDRCFCRPRGVHLKPFVRRGAEALNRGWLDKWQAYCLLATVPGLGAHLPETAVAQRAESIEQMLARHPLVYLKPAGGSIGRGIIRVSRGGMGCFRLGYVSRETGRLREVYATTEQMDRWLTRQVEPHQYLVQQGLNLNVAAGRPADVRVLIQKDGTGAWQITGMGARVAAAGRFTANLHTGGTGVPVVDVLRTAIPGDEQHRQELVVTLERLAHLAAAQLDGHVGPLGELGLDFGIDAGGQAWFIEQNFQPGRAIFAHLGRWDLFDLAHLRPVQYARYLADRKKSASAAPTAAT